MPEAKSAGAVQPVVVSSRVSVIVPCRNELSVLPRTLAMLEGQTRQPDQVVFADGLSTDGSREWLHETSLTRPWMTVVDNVQRIVPAALNTAFDASDGDFVARMDTHAEYSPNYLASVVAFLEAHPEAGGVAGAMETRGRGPWGRAIASTLSRRIGLGGAAHRVGAELTTVQHAFSPCYRREVITAIGRWDTRFLANEDFEADVRLNRAGWKLFLLPDTGSAWYVRETPAALAKQMWRYGYFKALTLVVHPNSLKARQLAPPLLVAVVLGAAVTRHRPLRLAAAIYTGASVVAGAAAAARDGASPLRGSIVPAIIHMSWGAGLLAGLVSHGRSAARFAGRTSAGARSDG